MSTDLFVEKGLAGKPIDHCLVIDAHGHIGDCPFFPIIDSTMGTVLDSMDRLGINLFAVSAMPGIFGDAGRGNRLLAEWVEARPDRFFGYMSVDIGYPERIAPQLERGFADGLRGIKIYPGSALAPSHPYNHDNYRPVFEFADAHGLPILAHTWIDEVDHLRPQFERYPNITWILAHTGCPCFPKAKEAARQFGRVYLETCFSSCPRGLIEELVAQGFGEKLVWGTDTIFMDPSQQLGRVLFAQIPPADKEKILGQNAKRALRL